MLISKKSLGNNLLDGPVGGGLWMHDWSAFSPVYNFSPQSASIPKNSFGTFVDVTGAGVLMFARADNPTTSAGAGVNPTMRITVDGIPYLFSGAGSGSQGEGNMLSAPIIFNISLKIEIQNQDLSSADTFTLDYLYLSKNVDGVAGKQSILLSGQRRMFELNRSNITTNVDVLNITGSGYLLGMFFSAGSTASTIFNQKVTLTVDGSVKMNDRSINRSDYLLKQGFWPNIVLRFNTSLRIQTRMDVASAGGSIRAFVWNLLD